MPKRLKRPNNKKEHKFLAVFINRKKDIPQKPYTSFFSPFPGMANATTKPSGAKVLLESPTLKINYDFHFVYAATICLFESSFEVIFSFILNKSITPGLPLLILY